MADNIARINGTDQAWYADVPAWHTKGTVTPGARTAKQVQKAVPAFRQPIELAPVYAKVGNRYIEIADKRATHRKGSVDMLGIVSDTYPPLNDGDALLVLESVVNAAKRASFVTAGLLGHGERGFASIDLSRVVDLRVKRDPSRHESHLFGTWDHTGTAAMRTGLYGRRIECNNLLNAGLAYSEKNGLLARIIHAGDLKAQIIEAQRILGFMEKVAVAHVAEMNALVDIAIKHPAKWLDGFVELVVPIPEGMERVGSREEARKVIKDLFLHSKTLVGVPQSPYRAYQAVVEYADHYRPLRIGGQTPTDVAADKRFRSIIEGPAAEMKSDALDILRREFLAPAGSDKAYADLVVPVLRTRN